MTEHAPEEHPPQRFRVVVNQVLASYTTQEIEALVTLGCYPTECLLLAEGVEEVGADGFCATIVPVG